MSQNQWSSRVGRLEVKGEILGFQLGDLLSRRNGRVGYHQDSSRGEVRVSP
jgi:hypothetical protein